MSYEITKANASKSTVGTSSDWTLGAGIGTEAEVKGFGVTAGWKTNLDYTYGNQFSEKGSTSSKVENSFKITADNDDKVQMMEIPFKVFSYPILTRTKDTISYLIAAYPGVAENPIWESGNNLTKYFPNHETGNVLSYPKPSDQDFTFDQTKLIHEFTAKKISFDGEISENLSTEVETALESSSSSSHEVNVGVSASVGAGGSAGPFGASGSFTVSGSAGYKSTSLNLYEQNMSVADEFNISANKITNSSTGLWEYTFKPILYWNIDNTLKLAMSVDFSKNPGSNWANLYGKEADPALLLPYRYDSAKFNNYVEDKLDQTKSLRFDNLYPNVGDTIHALVKVFNYSLKSTNAPVEFSLYIGHPDNNIKIKDIKGNSIFSTKKSLLDQGREVVAVRIIVTADMAHNIGGQKIYIKLDPQNSITEIHENNNIGWSKLGGGCYTPFQVSVADVTIKNKQLNVVVFPNPAATTINIKSDFYIGNKETITFEIYSIHGQLMLQTEAHLNGLNQYSCNINQLPSGLYIYKVLSGKDRIHTGKIIVNN